jgi:hypothetical protein
MQSICIFCKKKKTGSFFLVGGDLGIKFIKKTMMSSLDFVCFGIPIQYYFCCICVAHEITIDVLIGNNIVQVCLSAGIESFVIIGGIEDIYMTTKYCKILEGWLD